MHCLIISMRGIEPDRKLRRIQLFRERLSEKTVHATIPKGNMEYDPRTFPDTAAVESTFFGFL